MKRNDIVHTKEEERNGCIIYGRIWRVLNDGRFVVVDGGCYVRVFHADELILSNYKGCIRKGRFVRMDSLKTLKRWASLYNPHFGSYYNAWGRRWTKAETKHANALISRGIDNRRTFE